MKIKRCKEKRCWEYCTRCDGGLIVTWEKCDEKLSNEEKLQLYYRKEAEFLAKNPV